MDNVIPINHSLYSVDQFINQEHVSVEDQSIADLATHPGWNYLKKLIEGEIERLRDVEMAEGESVEEYGFKCIASAMCRNKLQWIVSTIELTHKAVYESGE